MEAVYKITRGIQHFAAMLILEQPARRIGLDGLIDRLETSARVLENRLGRFSGRPRNLEKLVHILSIELWGQRRLRAALGEPQSLDESDHYRPSHLEWSGLQKAFRTARQSTIGLGKTLRMAGVDPNIKIEHNQFGTLSVLAWIYYLEMHARVESLWFN